MSDLALMDGTSVLNFLLASADLWPVGSHWLNSPGRRGLLSRRPFNSMQTFSFFTSSRDDSVIKTSESVGEDSSIPTEKDKITDMKTFWILTVCEFGFLAQIFRPLLHLHLLLSVLLPPSLQPAVYDAALMERLKAEDTPPTYLHIQIRTCEAWAGHKGGGVSLKQASGWGEKPLLLFCLWAKTSVLCLFLLTSSSFMFILFLFLHKAIILLLGDGKVVGVATKWQDREVVVRAGRV